MSTPSVRLLLAHPSRTRRLLPAPDEAGPGDFIYVPPYVPHQEINPLSDEPCEAVVVRSGQEPIVVNLDIDSPEPTRASDSGGPFHPNR